MAGPDQRDRDPVTPEDEPSVEVQVRVADGTAYSGEVANASLDGLALIFDVRFSGNNIPSLTIGEMVDLVFANATHAPPLTTQARVVHRSSGDGSQSYGLRFTDDPELSGHLPSWLLAPFTRRVAYRASASHHAVRAVVLRGLPSGSRVQATLYDISSRGAGVRFRGDADSAFTASERIELSFTLPGLDAAIVIEGVIRHRRPVGADFSG